MIPAPLTTFCDNTFFHAYLGPWSVIVDAGANVGTFSRLAAARFGCPVYAIEPNPEAAAQIKEATVVAAGLSNRDGEALLHLSANSETCSFYRRQQTRSITVPTITLATLKAAHHISKIDLLKLDIEGAELDVLAALTSDCNIGQIAVEFHEDFFPEHSARIREVTRQMERIGFRSYNFSAPLHTDVLFVNRALVPVPLIARTRVQARVAARRVKRAMKRQLGVAGCRAERLFGP